MTPRGRVAVVIPCRDEESTIGGVVSAFAAALPGATVYVFDNRSTDLTAERAEAAGAVVRKVFLPGKGNVVRRMFADVEADCYVLVDGDGTYDAGAAPEMVELICSGHDLVNVARVPTAEGAFRRGHQLGNRLLGSLLGRLFGCRMGDVLSGYKACSRRLVKSFPILSGGFEIETELMVHALELNVSAVEIQAAYGLRPPTRRASSVPGATECASCGPSSVSPASRGLWPSSLSWQPCCQLSASSSASPFS